jgi:4-hydroxybenzoate polyprenyltransferase
MKKLQAILTITRFPNLIFIFLTQVLVYHQLIQKPLVAKHIAAIFTFLDNIYLAISTTCIAAAGYIINDYFDVKIDEINKPKRVTVELQFKRRTVMIMHIVLNAIALLLNVMLVKKVQHYSLLLIPIFTIISLVFYSFWFKRKPIIGNVMVAIVTAIMVLMPALHEPQIFTFYTSTIIFCLVFFSFLLTLLREIVKDMEDLQGDAADGCRTLPIVMGINFCKKILLILAFIFFIFCGYVAFQSITIFAWLNVFVILILPTIGLILFCFRLVKANTAKHFKQLSALLKIITFLGIIQIYFI